MAIAISYTYIETILFDIDISRNYFTRSPFNKK